MSPVAPFFLRSSKNSILKPESRGGVLCLQEMPSDVQGALAPAPSHVHLDILYGGGKVNLYSGIGVRTNDHEIDISFDVDRDKP
ncbi:hypothetical protein [Desulfofustis glycolicus]|uniref:Uncharacterized protein n=1 Tax=Desulfofustis glycolicus DSM 9705 TaxID=1121409 RepID=A0A1M5XQV4_9BACT|nr:hypothetical protein [Desulfofustis glycolicus]MCB2217894.1 hypothetical protein [Desulfobulbaceae bacterium]SHI01918.1 hypothetical protein SAMN02745124_03244 [Desulfofustis glycolicus DSM 9705]